MRTSAPILVVEDEDSIREILGLVLEAHGYRVDGVANGSEALEYLATHPPPSLILLDLMLPVMDGEELMQVLRRNGVLRDTPVVIVSGHHAAREKAEALHATGCLPKPVDMADLLRTVEQYTSMQPAAEP
jgi:CheY-like chemotaxis protein